MRNRDELHETVVRLFTGGSARHGPYEFIELDRVDELVPGCLYRYRAIDVVDRLVFLRVYAGLKKLGGQLWEQEVGVLQRIGATKHPAIPLLVDGGYDSAADVGFVVTEAYPNDLGDLEIVRRLRADPLAAARHFEVLADGLAMLHASGLMHRNLTPAAIQVDDSSDDPRRYKLRLARFEMSSLMTGLLRRKIAGAGSASSESEIRPRLTTTTGRDRAYVPPERISGVHATGGGLETERTDVYALGLLAWELFIGDLPESTLDEEPDAPESWLERLHLELRRGITSAALPPRFKDLIGSMIDRDPRSRLGAGEVVSELASLADTLRVYFDEEPSDKRYLVGYMPDESDKTIRRRWGWVHHETTTSEGRQELKEFLEADLEGAELVHAPGGAYGRRGIGGDKEAALKAAEHVLVGKQVVWFCDFFKDPAHQWRPQPEGLIIKYLLPRGHFSARDLEQAERRVRIPAVDLCARETMQHRLAGRPSWEPCIEEVRRELINEPERDFCDALAWLLDLQSVELESRAYAYVIPGDAPDGSPFHLLHDRQCDDDRIDRKPLFRLYADANRQGFGDFFLDTSADNQTRWAGRLELCPSDHQGRPNWRERRPADFVRREDGDRIAVRFEDERGASLPPASGWVRPYGDGMAHQQLQRMREALTEIREMKGLIAQLRHPSWLPGLRPGETIEPENLKGKAVQILQEMLSARSFYAVHGPPGTGKTRVCAHAVNAFLGRNSAGRILVSAQSNFALDNLALRIRREVEGAAIEPILIRTASELGVEKVHDDLQDLLLENVRRSVVRRLQGRARERIRSRSDPPAVLRILKRWIEATRESEPEIQERLRRGANVMFATCGTSTPRNIATGGRFGIYDWVIVEEAAKAWPTELALPLVRGIRWLLVGDHYQLPAHRKAEVEATLDRCAASDHEDLAPIDREVANRYIRVFDLFGSLFDDEAAGGPKSPPPLGRLDLQFRMQEPICRLVSHAFYKNTPLRTGTVAKSHGLHAPHWLQADSVVWIDMQGYPHKEREERYSEGEIEVIATLLERMRPGPLELEHEPGEEPLAVLSPYRRQLARLATRLPDYADTLYSIHEYQGREANIVICSLVRDQRSEGDAPHQKLGFLTDPSIANVMFSRARRLLVIVGDYAHFEHAGVPFWHDVCEGVTLYGTRVQYQKLLDENDG